MQAAPEAPEEAEEEEAMILLRKLRAVNCGDDAAALTDACRMAEGLTQTVFKLQADIRRLKSSQSFGYVRGRGMLLPRTGKNIPKPVVPALDIPPVAAQIRDD